MEFKDYLKDLIKEEMIDIAETKLYQKTLKNGQKILINENNKSINLNGNVLTQEDLRDMLKFAIQHNLIRKK